MNGGPVRVAGGSRLVRWGFAIANWVAFGCWAALLWYLSSQPPRDLPGIAFAHADKVAHFVYFGFGAFVLALALRSSTALGEGATFGVAVVTLALVGLIDEWRQLDTPGRQGGDHMDFVADMAGSMLGVALGIWFYERLRKLLA